MTTRADVRRVVKEALDRFGRIDVWVNNVGQDISRPPSQLTDDDIDEMMRVNMKSAFYGMQEILPHFQGPNAGHAINVPSMLGASNTKERHETSLTYKRFLLRSGRTQHDYSDPAMCVLPRVGRNLKTTILP